MDGSGRGLSGWAEAGAALDQVIEATRAAWSVPDARSTQGTAPADPAAILNQATMLAFSSGLRYCAEVAAICGRHATLTATIASQGKDLSESQRRRMTEELRELMREVGELAFREARRFQSDLEALAVRLAANGSDPATAAAPRRYARAKP